MRLTCEAHIDFRKTARPTRKLGAATLTIRADIRDKSLYNLVLSTKKETECGCYKNLKANIVKLFVSCVKDGKMTISFKEPEHDLLIRRANVSHLEKFVSIIRAIGKGEGISTRFLKEAKMEEPPPRIMRIAERSKYPVRGFPPTLERLHITHIRLSRIQRSIIDLENLVELCLDDNALKTIPSDFSSTRLVSLSLARNELTELNDIFLGSLGRSIKDLNLSHNQITQLTYSIARPRFRTLDLSHNRLSELPTFFKGGEGLQLLRLEGNKIVHLPSSFLAKNARVVIERMEILEKKEDVVLRPSCPSLVELSCIRLHQHCSVIDEPLERVLPRRLHAYLLSFVRCRICGKFTYPSPNRKSSSTVEYLEIMNSVEAMLGIGFSVATRMDYLCSESCYARYRQHNNFM